MRQIIILFLLLPLFCFSQNKNETQAEFAGGEKAMYKFIDEHLKINDSLFKKGMDGDVKINFEIDETGKVKNPTLQQALEPSIDSQLMAAVNQFPNFKPAHYDGQNVSTNFHLIYHVKITATKHIEPTQTIQYSKDFSKQKDTVQNNLLDKVDCNYTFLDKHTIVKFSLFSWLFRGQLPIIIEHKMKEKFSMEFSIAPTFRSAYLDVFENIIALKNYNDFSLNLGSKLWHNQPNTQDIFDDWTDYSYRKALMGIGSSIAPKFYFDSPGLTGFFFSPKIAYALHRFQYQQFNSNLVRDNNLTTNENLHCISPSLNVGFQYFKTSAVFEINFCAGITYVTGNREDDGIDLVRNQYINGTTTVSQIFPLLLLEFKAGFTAGKSHQSYFHLEQYHSTFKPEQESTPTKPIKML